MKNMKLYMAMLAMGVFMPDNYIPELTEKDVINSIKRSRERKKKQLLCKGCKIFTFGDICIYALNQENADRKYKNYIRSHEDI